ncbi:MAG: sugar phosphate isomerase/epimerase family protein [Methanomicrobiales archaeon]|nr:sugar phosphate isomerase/epimerase family protein [Methanomicrobiales archaeon]
MFGISTYCLHSEPLPTALERIAALTDKVEIMDDGNHFIEDGSVLESYSAEFFFHAPCRSVNIASSLEPIRRGSVEVLSQAFRMAAEVDAPVVIHPGYWTWKEERERALHQFTRSLEELLDAAEELSVTFYVENMGNWDYFLLRYPEEVGLIDGCGLALDIGHAHLNDCLDKFLEMPIAHFHLHDNDGKEDTHSAIGKGNIDFGRVIDAMGRSRAAPIVEVETYEGTVESLGALRRMMQGRTSDNPEDGL